MIQQKEKIIVIPKEKKSKVPPLFFDDGICVLNICIGKMPDGIFW